MPTHIQSLLKIPAEIVEAATEELNLRFGPVGICIRCNDPAVIGEIRRYHAAHVVEEKSTANGRVVYLYQHPGFRSDYQMRDFSRIAQGKKVKEEFIDIFEGRLVRKKKYEIEMYFDGMNNIMVGDLKDNVHQIALFLNVVYARTFLAGGGYMLLNAAAIAHGDSIIALTGGPSPSVLLAFLDQGFKLTTFDRLMVRNTGDRNHALGYHLQPRIHPGSALAMPRIADTLSAENAMRYGQLSPAELWSLNEVVPVDVSRIYGSDIWRTEGDLKAVCMLEWEPESRYKTRTEPMDTDEMLSQVSVYYKDLGVFDLNNTRGERLPRPDMDHLSRVFEGVKRLRVRGRLDPEILADLLKNEI